MTHPDRPPTPALDHMQAQRDALHTEAIGEFLEWCQMNGLTLCTYDRGIEKFWPDGRSITGLLADYAGVDLAEAEREKARLLDWLRGEGQTRPLAREDTTS